MSLFQASKEPNRSVHYEVFANCLPGTTLFVHGNLASNRWWHPAKDVWTKRAAGSGWTGSMILAEFRGCGDSTAPTSEAEVNMKSFAKDFIALVKNQELKKVNLVGHSTGGLIVALMAAMEPDLFGKALLLDPVGAAGVKFDDAMTVAFEAMKKDKGLTGTVIGSTILNNDPDSAFFKQVVVEDAYKAVNNVGAWVLKALDGFDVREDVQKVSIPTLTLHGEHDALLPIKDSQEIARLMGGRFEVLKGAGHCGNVENPSQFVEVAHGFLFS